MVKGGASKRQAVWSIAACCGVLMEEADQRGRVPGVSMCDGGD